MTTFANRLRQRNANDDQSANDRGRVDDVVGHDGLPS